MSTRQSSSTKPAGLSQLNLNAAGIDVGATSHFVAVPADRAEQPVQEFEAFTADLYRLADWLTECSGDRRHGVDGGVLDTAVRSAARLPGMLVDPAHQERAWSQDRRGGLPVAAAAPHLRTTLRSLPA